MDGSEKYVGDATMRLKNCKILVSSYCIWKLKLSYAYIRNEMYEDIHSDLFLNFLTHF